MSKRTDIPIVDRIRHVRRALAEIKPPTPELFAEIRELDRIVAHLDTMAERYQTIWDLTDGYKGEALERLAKQLDDVGAQRRAIGRAVAVLSDRQDSLTLIAQMKLSELGCELVTDGYDGPHTRAAVGTLIAEAVNVDNPGGRA